jgi:hypothetical protein
MQRLTAKLLLLFALAGSFIPLAMAATAEAPHACCIRKAHHCHDSAGEESEQRIIRSASCCNHDCCRAVTTARWAYPVPSISALSVRTVTLPLPELHSDFPAAKFASSQSTRAPPAC